LLRTCRMFHWSSRNYRKVRPWHRTFPVNIITLHWLFRGPPRGASVGVTHSSCNPHCWPGPSGRWGVRWAWLASTTWERGDWRGWRGDSWVTARDAAHNGARVHPLDRSQQCSVLLIRIDLLHAYGWLHGHWLFHPQTAQNQEKGGWIVYTTSQGCFLRGTVVV
jgi:hypothetical protein